MIPHIRLITPCLLILLASTALQASPPNAECRVTDRLDRILASPHRSEVHRARDNYRHPAETLAFFAMDPSLTVVEIWPGGAGWYSEILAPYLKGCGDYYAAGFDPQSDIPFYRINAEKLKEKFLADPTHYAEARITVLQPPEKLDIAPAGSADRVLTFRNVHNWMKAGSAEAVFASMFRALKPGGILGVVEHRAPPGTKQDTQALSGYVTEDYVIQLAEKAGFKLLARSDINANPLDDTDHPEGVWTLPPSLRLGDKDREAYLAIGESDRMTLKFIKPSP